MPKYTPKQANEKLIYFTNNRYCLPSLDRYKNMITSLPIKNNITGDIEINSIQNIIARVRNRSNQASYDIKNQVLLHSDYSIDHFKSNDYSFPILVLNNKSYIRVFNVMKHLNLGRNNIYKYSLNNHNISIYYGSAPSDIKRIFFSKYQRSQSVLTDMTSLYHSLVCVLNNNRIHLNRKLASLFIHDLYERYKNEINGLTQMQLALDKHNVKVKNINKNKVKAGSINTGQAMENVVKRKEVPVTSNKDTDSRFSLNDVRHIVNKKVGKAVNEVDERITHNYEWQIDVLRKKLKKYPNWDDILSLKQTNHNIRKELTTLRAKVNRQPWYKRVLAAAFN